MAKDLEQRGQLIATQPAFANAHLLRGRLLEELATRARIREHFESIAPELKKVREPLLAAAHAG